jgi:hypothetical protein
VDLSLSNVGVLVEVVVALQMDQVTLLVVEEAVAHFHN